MIFVCLGVINAVGGVGPRDEQSYQAGRSAGDVGPAMVKFGGATPEGYCDQRFTLSTPLGEKTKYRRGDFMDGCLDALEEKLDGKS